jgi:hypothetical protein
MMRFIKFLKFSVFCVLPFRTSARHSTWPRTGAMSTRVCYLHPMSGQKRPRYCFKQTLSNDLLHKRRPLLSAHNSRWERLMMHDRLHLSLRNRICKTEVLTREEQASFRNLSSSPIFLQAIKAKDNAIKCMKEQNFETAVEW